MHPAPGHASGTLVNALIAHCGASLSGIGGVKRPGIVHRLDKDTTGLMVAAKTDARAPGAVGAVRRPRRAMDGWSAAIAPSPGARPSAPRGVIDAALARSTANRTKIAVVAEARGRRAVTRYEVLERVPRTAAARRSPACCAWCWRPGARTRCACISPTSATRCSATRPTAPASRPARASFPLPAQAALEALGRQALHAAELAFVHPVTGKRLSFVSPLPPDMARLVAALARRTEASPHGCRAGIRTYWARIHYVFR